ncbi:MAG: DUF4430 domain-containing protein [Patescibacteria group bacterium]
MQKRLLGFLLSALAFVVVFYGGYAYGVSRRVATTAPEVAPVVQTAELLVSVMVDEGDGTIKIVRDIAWRENQTVFDVLKEATEKGNMKLGFKDYGGDMGVFIESIDEKKGSMDAWWQYWINNTYGEKGASTAIVKPGDVMVWKLVKGQFTP